MMIDERLCYVYVISYGIIQEQVESRGGIARGKIYTIIRNIMRDIRCLANAHDARKNRRKNIFLHLQSDIESVSRVLDACLS